MAVRFGVNTGPSAWEPSVRFRPLAPLALEAVKKIDAIFDIEREINGLAAEERVIVRHSRVMLLVGGLEDWLRAERAKLSRHAEAAKAMD